MPSSRSILTTYYVLEAGTTLAASLIWGINTIFLLDAGLSNFEAFAANAFFTAGMVVFEVPTGVVADGWGRRLSFLLGTLTLSVTTGLYVLLWQVDAQFWAWALVSTLLGLGFTFFSGAVEAWLVDALEATAYGGSLEAVLGRGQVIGGVAMLLGSVGGGILAQATSLGVPFVARAVVLVLVFVVALATMHDVGFTPDRSRGPLHAIRSITAASIEYGWRVPPVRFLMLAAPFTGGVGFYVFYALQPYLLELYGNEAAYGIAGLTAAIVAGAQMLGGLLTARIRRLFRLRTSALLVAEGASVACIVLIGLIASFWVVLALIVVWGLLFAAAMPIRQAYLNALIPSKQRATILSFDSLMSSSGGVVVQPGLGRAADVWGYPASYLLAGAIGAIAIPFIARSRAEHAPADAAQGLAPADAGPDASAVDAAERH
ncbi:MAG TPA: MFS transporter [Actinomycetota bacterium]|jgi:MFS family permease|nr:MFS transporter [Actinomycetota bacterium]